MLVSFGVAVSSLSAGRCRGRYTRLRVGRLAVGVVSTLRAAYCRCLCGIGVGVAVCVAVVVVLGSVSASIAWCSTVGLLVSASW